MSIEELQAENARLKAQVERLTKVIAEAQDFLGDCRNLEIPACNAYALLMRNSAKQGGSKS